MFSTVIGLETRWASLEIFSPKFFRYSIEKHKRYSIIYLLLGLKYCPIPPATAKQSLHTHLLSAKAYPFLIHCPCQLSFSIASGYNKQNPMTHALFVIRCTPLSAPVLFYRHPFTCRRLAYSLLRRNIKLMIPFQATEPQPEPEVR